MCGHHEDRMGSGWSGMEVGALVDGVGSIRKASAVLREAGIHSFF